MTQTYVITYGIPMGTSQRITGTGFVHARSYQHAWAAAEGSCGKGEQVLYVDLPPDPYPQDLDLLDYGSTDVI